MDEVEQNSVITCLNIEIVSESYRDTVSVVTVQNKLSQFVIRSEFIYIETQKPTIS